MRSGKEQSNRDLNPRNTQNNPNTNQTCPFEDRTRGKLVWSEDWVLGVPCLDYFYLVRDANKLQCKLNKSRGFLGTWKWAQFQPKFGGFPTLITAKPEFCCNQHFSCSLLVLKHEARKEYCYCYLFFKIFNCSYTMVKEGFKVTSVDTSVGTGVWYALQNQALCLRILRFSQTWNNFTDKKAKSFKKTLFHLKFFYVELYKEQYSQAQLWWFLK